MKSLQLNCLDLIVKHRLPTTRLPSLLTRAVERHKRSLIFSGNFQYVCCNLGNGSPNDVTGATISIEPGGEEGEDWVFSYRSHLFCGARCFRCEPVPTPPLQQYIVREEESVEFFTPFVECERRLKSVFPKMTMKMTVEVKEDNTGVLRWRGGDERGEFRSAWHFYKDGEFSRRIVHRGGYTTKRWERIKNFIDVALECEIGAEKAYTDNERMNRENQHFLLAAMPHISENNCAFLVDDSSLDFEFDSQAIESSTFQDLAGVPFEDLFTPLSLLVQN